MHGRPVTHKFVSDAKSPGVPIAVTPPKGTCPGRRLGLVRTATGAWHAIAPTSCSPQAWFLGLVGQSALFFDPHVPHRGRHSRDAFALPTTLPADYRSATLTGPQSSTASINCLTSFITCKPVTVSRWPRVLCVNPRVARPGASSARHRFRYQ